MRCSIFEKREKDLGHRGQSDVGYFRTLGLTVHGMRLNTPPATKGVSYEPGNGHGAKMALPSLAMPKRILSNMRSMSYIIFLDPHII